MQFFSEQLISTGYLDRLNQDLQRADLCRFLVAYISQDGLRAIDRAALVRTLRHEDSFGLSSLSCACGYEPLLKLQCEIGDTDVRLKYFMDPLVTKTDEPDGIALFHSKLVYLRLPRENKSVIYIGSHNWSGRALGLGRPHNVEASLRFELDYAPEHLTGSDSSIASQVNRHLLAAFVKPACFTATPNNKLAFEQWTDKGCHRAEPSPLDEIRVILAVRKTGTAATAGDWSNLENQGIYLQALEEKEGKLIHSAAEKLLVMVWDSHSDLAAGRPPVLLRCRESAHNEDGTNRAQSPMEGFGAAIYDEAQLLAKQRNSRGQRSSIGIWSGRDVEMYDFEFRQQPSDSAQIDGGIRPPYQFHLEVEHIIFPTDRNPLIKPTMLWTPGSFAVAKSKDAAKLERVEGYYVPPELHTQILLYLTEELLIDRDQAKVWPVSHYDQAKEGKRFSKHPLHDTFFGPDAELRRDEFYGQAKRGSLVAELDDQRGIGHELARPQKMNAEPIERVQKVFTTKLASLEDEWRSIAMGNKPKDEHPGKEE